jgi:hypothetical protein
MLRPLRLPLQIRCKSQGTDCAHGCCVLAYAVVRLELTLAVCAAACLGDDRAEIRGMRPTQEDTLIVSSNFDGTGKVAVAIFDGHRGSQGAITSAINFSRVLSNNLQTIAPVVIIPDPDPSNAEALLATSTTSNTSSSGAVRNKSKPKRNQKPDATDVSATSSDDPILAAMAKSFADISNAILQSGYATETHRQYLYICVFMVLIILCWVRMKDGCTLQMSETLEPYSRGMSRYR